LSRIGNISDITEKKITEEMLQASEEEMRAIFDIANV
jgi:PAS domain-containing protein